MAILPAASCASGGSRLRTILVISSILLLALPLAAADGDSFSCHSWELMVGDPHGTGAGASTDDGATYTSVDADGLGQFYVVNDGPPGLNDWIFSIWVYQESNGHPGLQRSDEVCDETRGGEIECDCTIL